MYDIHTKGIQSKTGLFNPFMPGGLFYLKSSDTFISYLKGVCLVFIITIFL